MVCEQKLRPNIPNRWQSCEVGRDRYHPHHPHQDQWAQFIQCYHVVIIQYDDDLKSTLMQLQYCEQVFLCFAYSSQTHV